MIPARIDYSKSFYKAVDGLSVEYSTVCTPANNEIIGVYSFRANGADPSAYAALVWDRGGAGETYIASTRGDVDYQYDVSLSPNQFTGNGSKKLEIVLTNNAVTASPVIGAYVEVIKLG